MSGTPPRSSEPDRQQCPCPEVNGMICHDREICTDPVVARLGWFAGSADGWRPLSELPEVKAALDAAREQEGGEAMSDVWIVLVEDRHADLDAVPFSTEEVAISVAREAAQVNASHPGSVAEAELTPRMRADGWVLWLDYSSEGDRVRVMKRTMDYAGRLR